MDDLIHRKFRMSGNEDTPIPIFIQRLQYTQGCMQHSEGELQKAIESFTECITMHDLFDIEIRSLALH